MPKAEERTDEAASEPNPILEWMVIDIIIMKEIQIHFIKLRMKFIGKLYSLKKVVMHDFISLKNAIETKR